MDCAGLKRLSERRSPRWFLTMLGASMVIMLGWTFSDTVSASASSAEAFRGFETSEAQESNRDYSKFKHENPQRARLTCLLCHRRENNSARPTLPGKESHAPCTGCHAQQFSNSSSPMCTICHSNVQAGTLKAFPRLRSFNVKFDHARHSSL